jgi:hypothetical protein
MNIETTLIDSAFSNAVSSAKSLGNSVVSIPPTILSEITDGTTQSVQTDSLSYCPDGITMLRGFRVTAKININGAVASKFYETLPKIKETQWPDFDVVVKEYRSSRAQEALDLIAKSYPQAEQTALLFKWGGIVAANAVSQYPKLASVQSWISSVSNTAFQGGQFPQSPGISFAELMSETSATR